jgi:hypothetical protein
MRNLQIGTVDGRPFSLPADFATRTLAIMAIRGAGKTIAATVIAEEMCEAGIPWVAFDPVSVWWGLRAKPDGSPSGYPVIVIGGEHGDIPFDRDKGAKMAEVIVAENLFCVLDMSLESKNTWRKFVTEFCDRMMEMRPPAVRHVFLEEAPEFVPQRPMGEQKRSLAAVDRLLRLGRNRGYGATIISQRFATVNKDVLTQACENIFAMRTIGKNDRDEAKAWIIESGMGIATDDAPLKDQLATLAMLPDGVGYFWSPQWLKIFERVQIRRRRTFHPGDTRTVGGKLKSVKLAPMQEAIERLRSLLSGKKVPRKFMGYAKPGEIGRVAGFDYDDVVETVAPVKRKEDEMDVRLAAENSRLKREVAELKQQLVELKGRGLVVGTHGTAIAPSSTEPEYVTILDTPQGKSRAADPSHDELYAEIRSRILQDPGVMLAIKGMAPELQISVQRHVIEADQDSLRGRIGMLIHADFFEKARNANSVHLELAKRGFRAAKPNVYAEMGNLASMGFFRMEKDAGRHIVYRLVEDMKVRVMEMDAA